jgi:membrane protease YdiL (CAAX protease family)
LLGAPEDVDVSGWIREHRLAAFFVLSYALAWVGLVFYAVGLLPEPLFLPCGPLVAALVVIGVAEGRPGYRLLLGRMTRWRVGWPWWLVAVGLPAAMVLATALLNGVTVAPAWGAVVLAIGLFLVNPVGGALGEEPGWRGYALPGLQARCSPLGSALILGVLVAGWHAPLVLTGQLDAISLVSTAAITVVYSWLFNRTGGSALVTLVAHAVQDGFTFGSLGYGPADLTRAEYLYCLVVVVVAVVLVAVDRAAWRAAPGHGRPTHRSYPVAARGARRP